MNVYSRKHTNVQQNTLKTIQIYLLLLKKHHKNLSQNDKFLQEITNTHVKFKQISLTMWMFTQENIQISEKIW